jgi:DNA-binding transcriptional MerR regulator
MKIGEIAAQAGIPAKTIRFWEDQHLLPPPARTPSGYRDYDRAVLERLAFIRQAQARGSRCGTSARSWTSATGASRHACTSPT